LAYLRELLRRIRSDNAAAPEINKSSSSPEENMDDPALATANFWLPYIDLIKTLAEAGVIVSLAVGLIAARVGAPMSKRIDDARELKIAQLTDDASRLSAEAQQLREKNLSFEAAVSPRILEQGLTAAALSKFAGVPFVVVSPSDFEPKRTAGQIRFMLDAAKWTRSTERIGRFAFPDGVVIHVMGIISKPNDPAVDAAKALVSVLNDNKIEARIGYPPFRLDENGKPLPPVFPPSAGRQM
jgi:hypothetical protein